MDRPHHPTSPFLVQYPTHASGSSWSRRQQTWWPRAPMYIAFTFRNCPGDGASCPPLRIKTEVPNKAVEPTRPRFVFGVFIAFWWGRVAHFDRSDFFGAPVRLLGQMQHDHRSSLSPPEARIDGPARNDSSGLLWPPSECQ